MPLPDQDFDTTEVAVPWRLLTDAGHSVVFATERGDNRPATDPLLLSGVVFKALGAAREPKAFYAQLLDDPAYNAPIAYDAIKPDAYDGLLLPGGHAKGMRQYLGSEVLQSKVAEFWKTGRPVGAICHGVLVLARAGVLAGRRTTCLPLYLEAAGYYSTFWRRGRYYRTYPKYVQTEVRESGAKFVRRAKLVEDGNYVSARWPGDAYLFAEKFLAKL
jgi:putative intracellular protease/amidase